MAEGYVGRMHAVIDLLKPRMPTLMKQLKRLQNMANMADQSMEEEASSVQKPKTKGKGKSRAKGAAKRNAEPAE